MNGLQVGALELFLLFGLYADFHSLRHWFITGLARAGISPKMAQTLSRRSDVRLTLGLYAC